MIFELRLGLALGKTRSQIRAMPYPEFRLWRYFYLLEPWGFGDQEYRTAALMSQIYNQNVPRNKQKRITTWIRNMPKMLMSHIHREMLEAERVVPDLTTPEGRSQASEEIKRNFQLMFGNRIERKDKP